MRKLLTANFARLRRDTFFWAELLFITIASIAFSFSIYQEAAKYKDASITAEDMMFNLLLVLLFACVFFITLRVGIEHEHHTIRNKLIIGHTRMQVFFAEYITCLTVSLILLAAMLLFSGMTGYLLLGKFSLSRTELSYLILCCILLISVISAMFMSISINIQNRAGGIVASMLFLFAILLLASYCGNALSAEKMSYSYVKYTMDGVEFGDLIENPHYIDGIQRTIYSWIYNILPTGQAIQLNNMSYDNIRCWPFFSAIMLTGSLFTGCMFFRKKDIK